MQNGPSRQSAVDLVNSWCRGLTGSVDKIPAVPMRVAQRIGIENSPGVTLVHKVLHAKKKQTKL